MVAIATVEELASALQSDLDTATANLLLLDLAQGLIAEVIGDLDPWPVTAKAIALAVAARAYVNPDGLRQETVGGTTSIYNAPLYSNGVYLSESEEARLQKHVSGRRGSMGTIRTVSGYPPVATCRDAEVWRS